MEMSKVTKGSCNCGAVNYEIAGEIRPVVACHCSQCRKQTGHYFAATNCKDDQIVIKGADNITWYAASDSAKRGFCKHCGSALFWKPEGRDDVSILAGSIDGATGLKLVEHIFVADKGDYYELNDGLPQREQ